MLGFRVSAPLGGPWAVFSGVIGGVAVILVTARAARHRLVALALDLLDLCRVEG